ncbi:hypothetical protein QL285_095933 [Trifolium repens]|nr:hypothetical protein QL285_095933 [Trifolium repens]
MKQESIPNISSHEHNLKLITPRVLTSQNEKEKGGYLKQVILYNYSTKLPSLKWTQMVKNGKFVMMRKKVMEFTWKRERKERFVMFF